VKRRPSTANARAGRELGEKEIEALTVAMVVAPGVYGRNRMFDLMSTKGAHRARTRAATVRGILRQLGRATAISLTNELRGGETMFVLRYGIATMRLTRVVELTAAELAALRVVAERANVRGLPPDADDEDLVTRALARLLSPESEVRKSDPPRMESAGADLSKLMRDFSF
jgi:hypothetical protein